MEGKQLFTIPEVATYLGISYQYAAKLAREGKLPIIILDKQKYVPRIALEKMLSEVKPNNPSQ
jgi:excisionase family DNA binding protein